MITLPTIVGDFAEFTATNGQRFYVKKHNATDYSLNMIPTGSRNRWGNRTEIMADIEFAQANGRLPAPVGTRW